MTHDRVAVAEWQATHERVCDLVSGLDDAQLSTLVPACPEWTVRDLFSHVVGLGADPEAGGAPGRPVGGRAGD